MPDRAGFPPRRIRCGGPGGGPERRGAAGGRRPRKGQRPKPNVAYSFCLRKSKRGGSNDSISARGIRRLTTNLSFRTWLM